MSRDLFPWIVIKQFRETAIWSLEMLITIYKPAHGKARELNQKAINETLLPTVTTTRASPVKMIL